MILEFFFQDFGVYMLIHEISGLGFTNGVFTCRGECRGLGRGGFPVARGAMGPEPDHEVLWIYLTGLGVLVADCIGSVKG